MQVQIWVWFEVFFFGFDGVFWRGGVYRCFFGRTLGTFSSPGELLWVMSDDTQGHLPHPPFTVLLPQLPHVW